MNISVTSAGDTGKYWKYWQNLCRYRIDLHLIEPLGFRLTGKELKKEAGMDYWEHLDVRRYMNFEEFLEKNPGAKIWMATTKAKKVYTEAQFESG